MTLFRTPLLAVLVGGTGFATLSAADPMADVCAMRAQQGSDYSGPSYSNLTRQNGVRLSGSVAFGVSRSSGPPAAGGRGPAFAGSPSTERRELEKARKYQEIFDDCMYDR